MEGDFIKINKWLQPVAWFYGLGVRLRNALFDNEIIKSRTFPLPVISVGNLTVGGTGKTPHTEYLIDLLHKQFKVAVLSRGYKRKSSGFVLEDSQTPMEKVGDEPYQMFQKYPDIYMAVDENRCHGIEQLMQGTTKDLDVVLLDDAFQHRYVTPGLNILLVDYHRLICYDKLLPAGRLREPKEGKNRANIVIITKCPKDCKPMDFRVVTKAMNLFPFQKLYFSSLEYGMPKALFNAKELTINDITNRTSVMLLTGIASPEQLILDMKHHTKNIVPLTFADHHAFDKSDVARINQHFAKMVGEQKIIITTEKDACRLQNVQGLSEEVKNHLYVLPVRITFLQDQQETFNQKIINYVRKNSRNRRVAEG